MRITSPITLPPSKLWPLTGKRYTHLGLDDYIHHSFSMHVVEAFLFEGVVLACEGKNLDLAKVWPKAHWELYVTGVQHPGTLTLNPETASWVFRPVGSDPVLVPAGGTITMHMLLPDKAQRSFTAWAIGRTQEQ